MTPTHTWQYFKQNKIFKKGEEKKATGGIYGLPVSSGARVSAEVSSVLTSRPFSSSPVFHRSVRRRSRPPLPPSPGPPAVPRPLSECHLANKTPVHTEPEQKKQKRPFHPRTHTAAVKRCHGLSEEKTREREREAAACLLSFILLVRAENFSPRIKEGIMANMADVPTLVHNH